MQPAMPTTVRTWLGSFAAAAADDFRQLAAVQELIDQSPLGTGAGFGIPVLEIDRDQTAARLGFSKVLANPLYAQLSRGKFEGAVLGVCVQIMFDLNKLATDLLLYSMKELGFVTLAAKLTTGSSIMPQKRNPDALELVRAKYHVVCGEELKLKTITANLISGYNRDLQLTKEPIFTGLETTAQCLQVMTLIEKHIQLDEQKCRAALTDDLRATERVYNLVNQGIPFRQAYRQVAQTERQKR
jgi:argininosuccinate lyase